MNVIVISLKRAPLRRKNIKKELERVGVSDYILYDAFDGADITNQSLKLTIKPGYKDVFRPINNGEIGCILSHVGAIKLAQILKYEDVLILEDDSVLCDDFVSRYKYMKKLLPKDWEHVYLGAYIPEFSKVNFNLTGIYKTDLRVLTTHSYLLNSSVYDKVIKRLMSFEATADLLYNKMILDKKLISYIFYPLFTYQNQRNISYISASLGSIDSKRFFRNKI